MVTLEDGPQLGIVHDIKAGKEYNISSMFDCVAVTTSSGSWAVLDKESRQPLPEHLPPVPSKPFFPVLETRDFKVALPCVVIHIWALGNSVWWELPSMRKIFSHQAGDKMSRWYQNMWKNWTNSFDDLFPNQLCFAKALDRTGACNDWRRMTYEPIVSTVGFV